MAMRSYSYPVYHNAYHCALSSRFVARCAGPGEYCWFIHGTHLPGRNQEPGEAWNTLEETHPELLIRSILTDSDSYTSSSELSLNITLFCWSATQSRFTASRLEASRAFYPLCRSISASACFYLPFSRVAVISSTTLPDTTFQDVPSHHPASWHLSSNAEDRTIASTALAVEATPAAAMLFPTHLPTLCLSEIFR
ncbi:hypothetical protein RvY_12315-3 [Ramazzottius varieornatus]|uniref:Uncharacterized protein n=1 Tax=Ramazzottius varieornatus TaxID=947166 RepID=A0A1D1VNA6_RAMVA|nr:hypothetical protein RvY_12315-3 [Ramazzottius varieornatus]